MYHLPVLAPFDRLFTNNNCLLPVAIFLLVSGLIKYLDATNEQSLQLCQPGSCKQRYQQGSVLYTSAKQVFPTSQQKQTTNQGMQHTVVYIVHSLAVLSFL